MRPRSQSTNTLAEANGRESGSGSWSAFSLPSTLVLEFVLSVRLLPSCRNDNPSGEKGGRGVPSWIKDGVLSFASNLTGSIFPPAVQTLDENVQSNIDKGCVGAGLRRTAIPTPPGHPTPKANRCCPRHPTAGSPRQSGRKLVLALRP